MAKQDKKAGKGHTEVGGDGTTASYTATSGMDNANDYIVFNNRWAGSYEAYLDEVTVSAIPEPSTLIIWSLLGAIGITIGWWSRRRKAA